MAANNFTGAVNSNWNNAGNWSLGAFPTLSDGNVATFTVTSPACTVNVSSACNVVDFTAYVNTITMTNQISVNGSFTFGSGMTVAGTALITCQGTASIKSNGFVWGNAMTFTTGGAIVTLLDDIYVSGLLTISSGAATTTFNGFNFYMSGSFTTGTLNTKIIAGTTVFHFVGGNNQTWIGLATQRNNITINKSANTLTLSGVINYNTGTITHTAGTVDAGTSTFVNLLATTYNTGTGITFNQINVTGNQTLNSVLQANTIQLATTAGFLGTAGFVINKLQTQTQGATYTFKSTNTYVINTGLYLNSSYLTHCFVVASTPASKAILTFNGLNSQQKIFNVDFTDIDASGGNKIWSYDGVITTSTNIGTSNSSIVPVTVMSF